jgi:exopolysaccharide/PEP-CTERM locus tyrosine autokinase
MDGDKDKMTDMKPIKRKGSLLERADKRFDFGGGQLRRVEPEVIGEGPVVDAQAVRREASQARRTAAPPPAAPPRAEPVSAPVAPTAPAAPSSPPAAAPVPTVPAASVPAAPVAQPDLPAARTNANVPARARLVPGAPMQTVNRKLMAENGLIDVEGNVGALAEEFRIIKRQLLRAGAGLPHGRRILVTSAQPDEGKSFSSINLALSLAAEPDLSVLLIDGDFARHDVPGKLGLVPGLGLMDALADPTIDIAKCVIPTDIPRLAVLPAGTAEMRDTELLGSVRMMDMIDTLDAGAPDRVIIFDSMPLLAASSAGVIAQHCGQVLVVVRADVTRESALRDAIGLIGQHNGISLLLNRVRFTPEGRRFGSYYGEGG